MTAGDDQEVQRRRSQYKVVKRGFTFFAPKQCYNSRREQRERLQKIDMLRHERNASTVLPPRPPHKRMPVAYPVARRRLLAFQDGEVWA